MKSKKSAMEINHWDVKNLGEVNVAVIDANVVIKGYDITTLTKENSLPLMPFETIIEAGILDGEVLPINSNVAEEVLEDIYKFYNDPLKKARLKKITELKISDKTANSFDLGYDESKEIIESKREEGYLPEEGDQKLLAYCLMLKEISKGNLTLITKDKDFTFFSKELEDNFGILVRNPDTLSLMEGNKNAVAV